MSITAIFRRAKAGVAAMPILMRMVCGGAMLATPILLLTLVFPLAPVNVQGRTVPYDELWASGLAPVLVLFLLLGAIASWGLALRRARQLVGRRPRRVGSDRFPCRTTRLEDVEAFQAHGRLPSPPTDEQGFDLVSVRRLALRAHENGIHCINRQSLT